KMAAYPGSGYQSPPTIGRTVDRIFEDAQFTGEIHLNGRKLRDYPKICSKYDLSDTTLVDISRNRLTEVPHEVCEYLFVEKINCYHNVIRTISDSIQQLQVLTHLILSRNQLTTLPPALCMLGALEVLHVSNNKLVSLPEEIKHLSSLMDLDVSCNELSHLPVQIGDLSSLRCLNLRRNFLVELPVEISRLQLYKLDFSNNRIEKIPTVFRKMETLEQFILDNNPLSSPPAYVCIKGRQHIMKFLQIEAIKEDRKRGILMGSDSDIKKFARKSLPPHQSSDDLKNMLGAPESKWKRHTVLSNDSGYSTADGSERNGWQSGEIYPLSEENNNNYQPEMLKKYKGDHHHQTFYQSYLPHHQQQPDQSQQQNQTTVSNTGGHNLATQPRSASALHQHSIPSAQQGDTYPEPAIPGRTSPAHVSTSYSQYLQRQYPHDLRHSHYRPHISSSSTSHPHSSAMYSSSSSLGTSNRQSPSPSFTHHSSDSQTVGHNNSFTGADSSGSLTRQRSNTSLSDYQSRQYASSTVQTAHRAYSPAVLTRYRPDSPTFRYGNSKPAKDYLTNGSQLPLSSHSTYLHQRESVTHERNIYQLPSRLERFGRESSSTRPPSPPRIMSGDMEDEFTRELKRQKAEYERKKKQAELIRVQQEEEEEEREKEERRRAALKLQEEQKVVMQKQEEQRRHGEVQRQEEIRRQEDLRVIDVKRRKEAESRKMEDEIQQLQDTVRIEDGEEIRQKGDTDKRAESKLLDKKNLINNGVLENSRQSSASTTPSVSPSPSPRNSVSHLAKPNSPSSSTSHLAKPISPSGSTSHLVKPTGTKSAVPRAANGPAGPAQSQAVRKTKLAGDRSNTASPVTARSTRTVAPAGLRAQGSGLTSAPSNLRRSSNSSTVDDEPKPRKGPTVAPAETSRLKAHHEEQNKKGTLLHSSAGKMQQKSDHPAETVDTNKRINTRPPTSTNIYGLSRGRPGGPKTLEDSSSNFSIHKKEEKEEAEQMDRLRQMVESRLRVTLPDNLAEALRDGVVLCHLANHVRPRSVGSIHVPSPAVPKLTLAKCRRNVDNFLDACRKIGVDQEQLCGPQDIFDEKGISRVAITVAALVAVGSNPRQSAV
ncbi:unnamed protein product, partial [Candidula unifasciata]